ncbi:MAG: RNA 2',3'-cyclic phosphodiesterase [Coriobacteriales bacterium]|jgi:2'-5' RNA ligase
MAAEQQQQQEPKRRLFVALTFGREERVALGKARDELLSRVRKGTPNADGNLHLTLAFLGMCTDAEERAVTDAICAAVAQSEPIQLELGALGVFSRRHGSVVWRSAAGSPALMELQQRLVQELETRGFELDTRPFTPHITLARNVCATEGQNLKQTCAEISKDLEPLRTHHENVSLMWSHHPEGGPLTYTPVFTEALGENQHQ